MKATFGNSFAKRSLVIAATALPSLYSGLVSAQTAPSAPAPVPAAVPAGPVAPATPAAPVAGSPAPPPVVDSPAVVTPSVAAPAAAAVPADMPPPAPPPAASDPDAETYKHIDMGVWMRTGMALQNASNPKKLDGIGIGGEVELHFSNRMRKSMAWTANFVASYGAPDGGSYISPTFNGPGGITGSLNVLDLIAQYEPDPAFNIWVGRMLVASDRSNFSGPYFMAPWIYPLFLGPQGNPYAIVGPKEGPSGRNDGATVWGQFGGGMAKYYLGAYNMFDATEKPLISGRISLSLLSPEPGYYGSSTYLGKDLLGLAVGGQYQKNGDLQDPMVPTSDRKDYGMVLADLLFEKDFKASGVLDVEGAFYKYVGDYQAKQFSYMGLVSYLVAKFQPLVRVQQATMKDAAGGNTVTMIDGQVAYYLDGYSTKMVVGVSHSSNGADGAASAAANSVFAGLQLQK